jgi:hypothetical protein
MVRRWFRDHLLPINPRKLILLTYSRRRPPIPTTYRDLSGNVIPRSDSTKDLGVTYAANLRFSMHSELVRLRALRALGCLTYATGHLNLTSPAVMTSLFLSLVMSKMTYASVVWSSITADDVRRLDVVINRFCRTVRHRNPPWHQLTTSQVRAMLGLFPSIASDLRVAEASFALSVLQGRVDSPSLLSRLNFAVPDIRTRTHENASFVTSGRASNPMDRAAKSLDVLTNDHTSCSRSDLLDSERRLLNDVQL